MRASRTAVAASLLIHCGIVALLFLSVTVATLPSRRTTAAVWVPTRLPAKLLAPSPGRSGGGGGSGSVLPPSRGRLPKFSPRPFVPPSAETKPAVLYLEPSIAVPPPLLQADADFDRYGDPLGQIGAPSSGPGKRGGIGAGDGGGFGPGTGPGAGEGAWGSGTGRTLGSTVPPKVIFQVDPEYSEEGRKARVNGTVVLMVEVDEQGRPANIRVTRTLGLGLDEQAVAAVNRWKFLPGRLNGKPVRVPALIEVNFRLL